MRPLLFVSLLCLSGQGYSAAASHGFSTGGPGLAEAHTESDYPVAEGPTSDVICWFISERHGKALADAALEAAEYARAAAWAVTGAGPDSAGRLVVHVYEKRKGSEGFAEAVDSVETGASEGVASWHHSESLGVYVKLQPVVTDYLQAELGFPRTSLHHIARETALLEFSLAGAAHSNTLPRWLHEGLAVHIADRALVDAGRMLTGGMDPLTSTRVHEVRRIRSAGRLPMVESWCAGEVGDLESHQIAAVDAVLLRFLCDRLGEEPLGSMAGAVLRGEFPSSQILPWLADTHGLTDIEEELHPWLDGLVALDAMILGKPPGSITVLEGEDMDAHLRNQRGSVHEVGLSDLMDALRLRGELPPHRALIGIEPAAIDWGTEPTDSVAAAVPKAATAAQQLVREWRAVSPPEA